MTCQRTAEVAAHCEGCPLKVAEGSAFALVGANGAGKTTITEQPSDAKLPEASGTPVFDSKSGDAWIGGNPEAIAETGF